MQKVAVVVVTNNRKKLLDRCLVSLMSQTHKVDKVFIIDNNSSDGTDNLIYSYMKIYGEAIEYTRLNNDIGDAASIRRGFLCAMQDDSWDYLLVMDDESAAEKNYIEKLLKMGEKHPEIKAFVGTEYIGNTDEIAASARQIIDNRIICHRKNAPLEYYRRKAFYVDTTNFVGLMVHKDIIKKIGLPDDSFFIYFNDIDYCFKLRKYTKILNVSNAKIKHSEESGEEDMLKANKEWEQYYLYRNELMLIKRNVRNILVRYGYILYRYLKKLVSLIKNNENRGRGFYIFTMATLDVLRDKMGKTEYIEIN